MIAMDACTIINLANAQILERVVQLSAHRLAVSPTVVNECNTGDAASIIELHAAGLIDFIDIDEVPADRYLELLDYFGLGEGETECIAVAESFNCLICCDDRKARNAATEIVGADAVMGSLRLIRLCVDEGIFVTGEAWNAYDTMITAGGFLPKLPDDYFG